MRDPIILLVHLIATLARLMGPGGLRSVVAESVLVKQQLLILNRSRHRAPNLCASDRILAGVCALFMRPARVIRSAIVLRPSTILEFHRALRTRKYRWLFSPKRRRTGPQGPSKALGALETRHAGPRISGWRAIIDRDRELCTKAASRPLTCRTRAGTLPAASLRKRSRRGSHLARGAVRGFVGRRNPGAEGLQFPRLARRLHLLEELLLFPVDVRLEQVAERR